MDQYCEMIREAKIKLRGADPEQRERGRETLRKVISEAEGSVYAKKAYDLLAAGDRPVEEILDPELDELMDMWPSIRGFADYRLADFLKRLETHPGVTVPLRADVIRNLRAWIEDALPRVEAGAEAGEIESLNDFVAAVRGVAAYEELPEFGRLRDELFHLRLQETAMRIDEALKAWALSEAWQLLDALGAPPNAFKAKVERLEEEVYEVDRLRREAQALLRRLPSEAPTNWFEAGLQAELTPQLRHYMASARTPQDWQAQLEEARARLVSFVRQFARAQAMAAVTLEQLRGFWTEFNRLPAESHAGRWEMGEDWFRRGLEALASDASREAERAFDPDKLVVVANRLRKDADGTPPPVAARITEMADETGRNAAAWKAMQEGKVFELPAAGSGGLPVPAAFREEAVRHAEWLRQIETAMSNFKSEEIPESEQAYADGLRIAEAILAQSPNHVLAHKLRLEASRRRSCYQLDRALAGWELEKFLDLFKTNNPGEIYAALVAGKEALIELESLTRRGTLASWSDAAQWWAAWRATSKQLPSAKPDGLLQALARQTAERQQQWYTALGKLLEDNLATPEECAAAAASLNEEMNDPNLQTYRQDLLRKVTVGWVERHIKSRRFAEAERELKKLTPTSADAERLSTRLRVEQARAVGAAAAAKILCDEWHNVRRYVAQPHRVLLETIETVWAENQQDWLAKLAKLLSRALATEVKGDAAARELAEWATWIEIEKGVLHDFSAGGVSQLARYLGDVSPSELLDRRLKKLLLHWQTQNDTVMLAWAYQAFSSKSEVAAPFHGAADDLGAEGDRVAERVLSALAERATLELDDLKPLRESLQREERRRELLNGFLNQAPHPVERPQESPKFTRAKSRLKDLTDVLAPLARLKDEDMRQEVNRQDFEDAHARAMRLDGVAVRARLLEELERLAPLRDLFSSEERIREAAERCRSKAPLDILEPGLFAELAGHVNDVIKVFVQAGAEGGAMWRIVSAEYEALIYHEACVLLPKSSFPQLNRLADTLEALHAEEVEFTQAITLLEDRDQQPKVASSGSFDPKAHLKYLQLIPPQAPRSLKVYHRFDRARRDTLKDVLEARNSRPHLPDWVCEYLDKGTPECANEQ